jgi:aryl-alcohol dehydrogenase-like predicted oxidoreductase
MAQLKTNIDSINVKWTDELEKAIDEAHHAQPNPAP